MSSRDTRARPLSRTEIARTALAIVDQEGIDGFNMRALADALA